MLTWSLLVLSHFLYNTNGVKPEDDGFNYIHHYGIFPPEEWRIKIIFQKNILAWLWLHPLYMWLTWQTSEKCFQFPKAPSGSPSALHLYLCCLPVLCARSLAKNVQLKCNVYPWVQVKHDRNLQNFNFKVNASPFWALWRSEDRGNTLQAQNTFWHLKMLRLQWFALSFKP